ncbi:MAG: lytic transglycosylase domain-containing protein, partial [Acidithiobacillus ferriphilus]
QHYNRNGYPTHIGAIPQQDVRWANAAAAENHIPAPLLLAVAAQESGFNANAVSPKGAQGLMQFMPGTWARYGQGSPFNPKEALFAGAAYLRHLALKLGSWPLAIAGYNAGGQAVVNAGYQIPPYRQTQHYVPEVLARYQQITTGGGR